MRATGPSGLVHPASTSVYGVVEPEFEILQIPKPVSLPLEGLDLVYQALHDFTGDPMLEAGEPLGFAVSPFLLGIR